MPDIIQLLPDSVANQIAAGEVIQRPASAVKELLENAVDAGGTDIKLIVKDAGKTLIQIIDNGCGMSETDARMSFERHATSKIKKAEDLFNIRTKGFRGEALASIAAIAHVELKTKRHEDEVGTQIIIEGSEIKSQGACSSPAGTSFSIKNLFYNVPARRNFLKSDAAELRHIIDEFQRVAMVHPEIAFSFHHNNAEVFHLDKGSFKQRLIGIFGNNYNTRLVPVEETTDIVKISGYIVKPEYAKKTRGEQFFFVNQRFIKSPYLHHSVLNAYQDLISGDSFPSYFLMLEVDPKSIDINIHPTKTEIKFEDEKSIYAILRSSLKQALGKHNIAPSIDFNQEASIYNLPPPPKDALLKPPTIKVDTSYNPFDAEKRQATIRETSNRANWEKLYSGFSEESLPQEEMKQAGQFSTDSLNGDAHAHSSKTNYQLHNQYIISSIKSGFIIIDQQAAHERILYEKYFQALKKNKASSQQELFPATVEFSTADFGLVKELEEDINALGFDIREFGKNTFVIHGVPSDATGPDSKKLLEKLIEGYKNNASELQMDKRGNLARSMARSTAIRSGKILGNEEMNALIDQLFACEMPYSNFNGKPILVTFTLEDLNKKFKK